MPRKYSRRNSLKRKSLKKKSLKKKSFKKRSFRRRSLRGGAAPDLVDLRRRRLLKFAPDQIPPGGETTQPQPQLETVDSNLSNTSSQYFTPREGNEPNFDIDQLPLDVAPREGNEPNFDIDQLPLDVAHKIASNLTMENLGKLHYISKKSSEVANTEHVKKSAERNTVIEIVSRNGERLENYPEYSNDREVVLAAVRNYGAALGLASPRLKDDKEVVLAAVHNEGYWGLMSASPRLQNDKEVVLAAVSNLGYALIDASPRLKNDKEVVLAAVRNYGRALAYASDRLRADRDVVLAAVQNDADALDDASPELQNDREVVFATNYPLTIM